MHESRIDILMPGSRGRGGSSSALEANGLQVELRNSAPIEAEEDTIDRHYLVLWRGRPAIWDREYKHGAFTRMVKAPGTISLGSAGRLPAARALSPFEVVACMIEPAVAEQIAEEAFEKRPGPMPERMGVSDPALAKLLELCADEAENQGRTGRLYGDSLAQALICRFMRLAQMQPSGVERAVPLPAARLRRVLDQIHTDFAENLGLDELAATSGFSRAHFLRMFRAATGRTPHLYLREIRLENARRLLAAGAAPITEIALACGFSSHSHMTQQFRERFGVTPSAYRKSA